MGAITQTHLQPHVEFERNDQLRPSVDDQRSCKHLLLFQPAITRSSFPATTTPCPDAEPAWTLDPKHSIVRLKRSPYHCVSTSRESE